VTIPGPPGPLAPLDPPARGCYLRTVRPLLALALACSACAGAGQTSRDAWDRAVASQAGANKGGDGAGGSRGGQNGSGARDNWQGLAQFTTDASELLAGGSTTVSLARLAERLCSEVPDTHEQEPAPDFVRCPPRTPLAALGREFELELGGSSIGLLAENLSDDDSSELVRQLLQRLRGVCREPWSRADNALAAFQEFHTCPTAGGAVLAVGRFPTNLNAGQWQFSLAVLGPG
jgi:hypothetical protein